MGLNGEKFDKIRQNPLKIHSKASINIYVLVEPVMANQWPLFYFKKLPILRKVNKIIEIIQKLGL
jgi:hypothetical protein